MTVGGRVVGVRVIVGHTVGQDPVGAGMAGCCAARSHETVGPTVAEPEPETVTEIEPETGVQVAFGSAPPCAAKSLAVIVWVIVGKVGGVWVIVGPGVAVTVTVGAGV